MKVLFTFWGLILSLTLFSQEVESLWCHELNTNLGLSSQEYNFYVFSDSEGFVWISSTKGLNRFDGQNIKQFRNDFQDSTALYGENIQSKFFEDSNKNLWFCTYEAIILYNRQTDDFRHYFLTDETGNLIKEDYHVFHLEQNKYLWIRGKKGSIYRIDISNPHNINAAFAKARPLFQTKYYHAYTGCDEKGKVKYIFASSDKKLQGFDYFELKNGAWINKATNLSVDGIKLEETNIFQIHHEKKSIVWFATNEGIFKWDIRNDEVKIFPPKFKSFVYFASSVKDFFIISAWEEGIFLFDKEKGIIKEYELKSISNPTINMTTNARNIYLDSTNVVWISVPTKGLLYAHLEKKKFESVLNNRFGSDKKETKYLNFSQYEEDKLLALSEYGIKLIDQKGHLLYQRADTTLPFIYHSIYEKPTKTIWLGTTDGLFYGQLKDKSFKQVKGSEEIDMLYIHQLHNDKILLSSLYQGIFVLNKKEDTWTIQNTLDKKAAPSIYTTIYQDSSDKIYACKNEAGIEVFTFQNQALKPHTSLPIRGAVYSFYENKKENLLWIGTSFGLVKLNTLDPNSKPKTYTNKDGLPDNSILSIIPDKEENLWLSTSKGLARMNVATGQFETFSLADGMLSTHFKPYSGLKLDNGTIFFGGSNGITKIPALHVQKIKTRPQILITEIKINQEVPDSFLCLNTNSRNINDIESLAYPYDKNTISFKFSATDYADPTNTNLRYKLEGVDKDWVKLENKGSGLIRYPNLPSGDYQLLLQGENSDAEIASTTQRKLSLSILPPFWETWWFRSLVGLVILAVILFIVWYRINQIREREHLKTRIAVNKMATLISQMKPHFIFNSLQSINKFILTGNRQLASEYLGRFSGLIRLMLENSRNTHHTIQEEKHFLNLYMKVEAQRFGLPFEYNIDIDEAIDEHLIHLPTMMLQPFVENAIWHGLSHKEEAGIIQIDIRKNQDALHCIIQDDGVGRKKAAELLIENGKKHPSRATEIIKERLQLLFPNQQDLCAITYTDLVDINQQPAGTKVSINFPIDTEGSRKQIAYSL